MGSVGSALSVLADHFTKEEQITALEAFLKTNEVALGPDNKEKIESSVKTAKTNLKWDQERLVEVRGYFTKRYGSATSVSFSMSLILVALLSYLYIQCKF